MNSKLQRDFFARDVLVVAPELIGKVIIRATGDKQQATSFQKAMITEVEAYRGEEDLACHARFGRTERNQVMYGEAGHLYVYLIYGMYWMLNIVTGNVGEPQAVLIRSIKPLATSDLATSEQPISGPGRVTRYLGIDKGFYGEDIAISDRIYIMDADRELKSQILKLKTIQTLRIGVAYAGEWAGRKWRWVLTQG